VKDDPSQKAGYSKLTCENATNTANQIFQKKIAEELKLPR
jgi:hypothetical protein